MKKLTIKGEERWDDVNEVFIPATKEYTLQLEHSLLSISKWEAIYHKPFLSTEKDFGMIKDYVKCMTINNVPDDIYDHLTPDLLDEVTDYINDKHTATWFSDGQPAHKNGRMNGEIITAEIVYYWMAEMNIPVEFQKWHLNRLLTLIRVISVKNDPKGGKGKKMTAQERAALNRARKQKYGIRG